MFRRIALAGVALAAGLCVSPSSTAAQATGDEPVTFTKDVARILQENCQMCHRPGSIGPMALRTYEEVRPWAPLIREKVVSRAMPPWPIDRTVGIQDFKGDPSLTDQEIQTIAEWVDSGAQLGDVADMPAAIEWPDYSESWMLAERFGEPDYVVTTQDFTVPAEGLDQWFDSSVEIPGIASAGWIRAIEIKPSNPGAAYVFHHGNSSLQQNNLDGQSEGDGLIAAAVGKMFDILPPDSGIPIFPGARVTTDIHYFPVGQEVPHATMDIGIYLYPEGEQPRFHTAGSSTVYVDGTQAGRGSWTKATTADAGGVRAVDIFIPPHGTQMLRGVHVVQEPTRIHSIRGHMHLRGKYQIVEAVYPDGRHEIINKLDWQHRWHTDFMYEDWAMPLLPKGTIVILTSYFDNSEANESNPDPDQLVVFGRRSVDEMSHIWIGRTFFTQEEFDELVAEREEMLRQRQIAQAADQ